MRIRKFGQHMVEDHTAANEQLMGLAGELGVQPPKGTDKEHQQKIAMLSKLSPTNFDQKYVSEQIKGHQEMISLFEQQVKQGQNEELTAFAEETLPTLTEHLRIAHKLQGGMPPEE